jgi:hypothetical protein
MTRQHDDALLALINAACNDTATAEQVDQLEHALRADPSACRLYLRYLTLDSEVHYLCRVDSADRLARQCVDSPSSIPPIVVQSLPSASSPLQSFIGSALFSYIVAAVIVGLCLGIAACVYVSQYEQYAGSRDSGRTPNPQSPIPNRSSTVARITAMVDCVWEEAGLPSPAGTDRRLVGGHHEVVGAGGEGGAHRLQSLIPSPQSLLRLGDRLALRSGLLEITYDTGARVILQGPVTYEVESSTGGYLSLGKLTAKLERKSEVRGQKSESANQKSQITNRKSSDLFAVRTPTAIVTDLGTEFGVEVNPSGETTSRVFRGCVQVQLTSRDGILEGTSRVLHENESVRVSMDRQENPAFVSVVPDAGAFVRRLPGRIPITLFNTGVGLKEGQPDPHWQLVAVSNDPHFRPRPAVVAQPADGLWMANAPRRSQWISILGDASPLPNNVTYTFRTDFDLTDVRPGTARLRGWFAVDNHVRAMRLNGRPVGVLEHDSDRFDFMHPFSIDTGFVQGANTLEIDVDNGTASAGASARVASGASATTLFHDDFENTSAVSRANYPDDSGNYNPVGANPGSWTINENNPNAVQVTASSTSPDPGAFQGTKCLRLRRAVDGKDIASAEAHFAEQSAPGERLRISAMVYVPAVEQDTDVAMQVTLGNADDYINLIANFDGHRSVVSHARHGALHDTGVNFTAGRWQKWEIEYAIGAETCALRIGDRRATGIPVSPVHRVDRATYWAHFNVGTPIYVDDVRVVHAEGSPMGLRVEVGGSARQK